jgi:TrkA domain protein
MSFFTESNIPGIGKKIYCNTHSKEKAALILHNDGKREFYIIGSDGEPQAGITLFDDESRIIGNFLSGSKYNSDAVKNLEALNSGIKINYYKIQANSFAAGLSIEKLSTHKKLPLSIIAVIKSNSTFVPSPSPEYILSENDICVIIGKSDDMVFIKNFFTE